MTLLESEALAFNRSAALAIARQRQRAGLPAQSWSMLGLDAGRNGCDGYGNGNGYGDGYGDANVHINGDGYGHGAGNGNGNGYGNGNGCGDANGYGDSKWTEQIECYHHTNGDKR